MLRHLDFSFVKGDIFYTRTVVANKDYPKNFDFSIYLEVMNGKQHIFVVAMIVSLMYFFFFFNFCVFSYV